jgi:hypothetical protein
LRNPRKRRSVDRFPLYVHDRIDANERFRERRRRARRRRQIRRALAAAVLLGVVAGLAVGAAFITHRGSTTLTDLAAGKLAARPHPSPLPTEVRGVHVTMALASVPGKMDEYLGLTSSGLNTIELDVKDENGDVAFISRSDAPLAVEIGAAQAYYDPQQVAGAVHARGVYLIGRVVVFEDPRLGEKRPEMAIRRTGGSIWRNNGGLAWANQYDKRVWKYNVDIAASAARAGFDEIQFDYVRFPSDGDVSAISYPGKRAEPKGKTIADFLAYAVRRLRPLGVRVSADVFGLAATHDLGIGQAPRRIAKMLDALYPMVYPSHFAPGEYDIADPNADPGRTVAFALADFRRQMRGRRARMIPWLQDFSLGRTYTLDDLRAQILAAREAHTRGFMLWNAGGEYTKAALAGG